MGFVTTSIERYKNGSDRISDNVIDVRGVKLKLGLDTDIRSERDFYERWRDDFLYETYYGGSLFSSCKTDNCVKIGNSNYLLFPDYEEFLDIGMLKVEYDAYVLFTKSILKNVRFIRRRDNVDILLASENDVYSTLVVELYDVDDDFDYYSYLIEGFIEDMESNVDISEDDIDTSHTYANYANNIILNLESGVFDIDQFATFLFYAQDICEWWDETFDKIRNEGVVEYFGLDN